MTNRPTDAHTTAERPRSGLSMLLICAAFLAVVAAIAFASRDRSDDQAQVEGSQTENSGPETSSEADGEPSTESGASPDSPLGAERTGPPASDDASTAPPHTEPQPTAAPSTAAPSTTAPSTTAPGGRGGDPALAPGPIGDLGVDPEIDSAINIAHGDRNSNMVLLTFDAGAERGEVERTLDLLAAEEIQAAFAFTGGYVRANEDAVVRLVEEGHVLVNHSDQHPSFTGFSNERGRLSDPERITTVEDGDQVLVDAAGVSSRPLFRPPYGDMDQDGLDLLPSLGYTVNLMWTIDCGGWLRLPAAETLTRCLDATEPGTIYLLHVGHESAEIDMLPEMIAEVRSRGLRFGRVDEFVRAAVAAQPEQG